MRAKRKLWRNKGGPHYMQGGKRIEPGQTFRATEEEIPRGIRDKIVLVHPEQPGPANQQQAAPREPEEESGELAQEPEPEQAEDEEDTPFALPQDT